MEQSVCALFLKSAADKSRKYLDEAARPWSDGRLGLECYSVITHPEKRCLEKLKLSGEIRPVRAHVLMSKRDLCRRL